MQLVPLQLGRSADFFYMLLFGSVLLSCVAPFINIQFLGSSLTFMVGLGATSSTNVYSLQVKMYTP
jgi:hypothetical protein